MTIDLVKDSVTPGPEGTGSASLQALRERRPDTVSFDAKFYIMDNLSDPFILGIPELRSLGLYLEPPDEHGRKWLQFTTLQARVPLLPPAGQGISPYTWSPMTIQGPESRPVEVRLSKVDYQKAVE